MKRIVAGPNAVFETLNAAPKQIDVIYLAEGLKANTREHLIDAAKSKNVPFETVARKNIDDIAKNLNHQGVVALTGDYPYRDLDTILDRLSESRDALLVLLDQIQDPGNLGAILRSAHAMGANGVIMTKDKSASMTPGAVRASAGASELVEIARVTNLARCIERLQDEGFRCHGAAGEAQLSISEIDWTGKTALILGNEGKGLRRLTKEHCDLLFKIPMASDFDSLNVSAATAISLYEASRQRSKQ